MKVLEWLGINTFRSVYLDHNATTPVMPEAARAVALCFKESWGNPSSVHGTGLRAREVVEKSRRTIAASINALPEEIIFTSGGTESNNLAIISGIREGMLKLSEGERPRVITSVFEHSSVRDAFEYAFGNGVEVITLPVTERGEVLPSELRNAINGSTVLVSIMMANNEVGTIMNIAELSAIASEMGAFFHTDAVQAFGKLPLDMKSLSAVSMMSISSHKVCGPKGVGALFLRSGIKLEPLNHGGHQERGIRGGTENVPGIAGFAAAAEVVCANIRDRSRHCEALRRLLYRSLLKVDSGIEVNGVFDNSLCNTLNLSFPGCDNRELLAFMSVNGIAVSTGAACSEGQTHISHVLKSMNLSAERAASSLRISFGSDNTAADVRYFVDVFKRFRSQSGQISMIGSSNLDLFLAEHKNVHILDIRFDLERRMTEGLPGSHEVSIFRIATECSKISRDQNILIVCQSGFNVFVAAQYMKRMGFRNIFILLGGISGYRLHRRFFS
ncbi:MAG: cysteine desulfurase NifS [Candidatus Wallbacteria bacterium HGW-Wallbacteria-1]|jgi:cysteine desulfurase|uniref:Cysteine desulfurase NifS n=1 Tax=Candidatus Wallbacteria bacterium HGW-Wallbacteria-1 TaxID=2013854 RepID=A0A2N1PU40_9BACT|nr:MAG: cysteine desulfurase NifS [Candidatus Wallbacteria bacterium HGW-Wallbacteria-1]